MVFIVVFSAPSTAPQVNVPGNSRAPQFTGHFKPLYLMPGTVLGPGDTEAGGKELIITQHFLDISH